MADELACLRGCFVQQFQAESVQPAAAHAFHIACGRLRLTIEHGVAAAFVTAQVVHGVGAIHDAHLVAVAGLPAVLETVALAQESAEHAVFGVEHGDVLVQSELQIGPAAAGKQISQLGGVQIIGDGECPHAEILPQRHAFRVGGIQ